MNILIPHSWLTEYLKTKAEPADIQRMLALCGPSVERIEEVEGEPVYDIEITTNRVDSFSILGIAREAAVILPQFGIEAKLAPPILPLPKTNTDNSALPRFTNDPSLNRRVLMILLTGVKHTPTPPWMARRLRQIGQNVHDSVIDITNYITHELGHPCHAFDADKLQQLGGEIIVKTAKAGWPFTTLDGESYTTVGGEVVFVNPTGEIIDLPGVKGTANSAVDDQTSNVLFFIESILPEKIRFTSMTHAIRTQAAQINEKDIDPHLADNTLRRAVQLYQELTSAQVASPVYDDFPGKKLPQTISLSLAKVVTYLGIELSLEKISDILVALDCQVESTDANTVLVTPPTYRPDLSIEADLIEEVARIYGYHNLPSVLMPTAVPTIYPEGTNFPLEERVQQLLADLGYQELYTYSLVSEELARLVDANLENTLPLRNPLTSDAAYLRRHILPSHVEAMHRQLPYTKLRGSFELANVYAPREGDLPDEHLVLAILDRDLRALRTSLMALFNRLHLTGIKVDMTEHNPKMADRKGLFSGSMAVISCHDRVLGKIGYLPEGLVGAELEWRQLLAVARRYPAYRSLPTTAPYFEDITLTIPNGLPVGKVLTALESVSEVIDKVILLDRYQDRWTFRLRYWDREKQVDAQQAQQLQEQALAAVAKLGVGF